MLYLVPGFRALLKTRLRRRFERALREQRIQVETFGFESGRERSPVLDADFDAEEDAGEGGPDPSAPGSS